MSNTQLESLIQGIQFKDPKLYDALREIAKDLRKINKDIYELQLPDTPPELDPTIPPDVPSLGYQLYPTYIYLYWQSPGLNASGYEVRRGTDWDSADRLLVTSSLSAKFDPLPIGTYKFWVKSISDTGGYSENAATVIIDIGIIGGISITSRVIDNNVLLYWNQPNSTFQIQYYKVFRSGVEIGTVDATFKTIFEQLAGTYTYGVIAVDVAGNESELATLAVVVNVPPDYELKYEYISELKGTLTNAYVVNTDSLLVNVNTTETWEEHFINHGL